MLSTLFNAGSHAQFPPSKGGQGGCQTRVQPPEPPMALKKSELYSSLWQSCDELRGGMDASQYKDYVLVLLFIKYISDKYAGQRYAPITIPPPPPDGAGSS